MICRSSRVVPREEVNGRGETVRLGPSEAAVYDYVRAVVDGGGSSPATHEVARVLYPRVSRHGVEVLATTSKPRGRELARVWATRLLNSLRRKGLLRGRASCAGGPVAWSPVCPGEHCHGGH